MTKPVPALSRDEWLRLTQSVWTLVSRGAVEIHVHADTFGAILDANRRYQGPYHEVQDPKDPTVPALDATVDFSNGQHVHATFRIWSPCDDHGCRRCLYLIEQGPRYPAPAEKLEPLYPRQERKRDPNLH